jgi:tRNA U38,U39,U40 pseudouridine synthase TruA
MLEVGRGTLTVSDFKRIFAAKDVRLAGASAKPNGLFLWNIHYSRRQLGLGEQSESEDSE